jgi:hypothetical protein
MEHSELSTGGVDQVRTGIVDRRVLDELWTACRVEFTIFIDLNPSECT